MWNKLLIFLHIRKKRYVILEGFYNKELLLKLQKEFVFSKFGIYGVSEPSALIMAGFDSKLIYKKTSYDGVTIAVAVSKC